MKLRYRQARNVAIGVLALSSMSAASAAPPEIVVLSNRADLISGGDALVEIKVPAYVNAARGVKVDLDGVNVEQRVRGSRRRSLLRAYHGSEERRQRGPCSHSWRNCHPHNQESSDRRSGFLRCPGLTVDVQHDIESFTGACARRAMQCPDSLSVHVSDDGESVRHLRSVSAATCEPRNDDYRRGHHRALHRADRTGNDESGLARNRSSFRSRAAVGRLGTAAAMEPKASHAVRRGHQPAMAAGHNRIGAQPRGAIARLHGCGIEHAGQRTAFQFHHCC